MAHGDVKTHRWRRVEYERLIVPGHVVTEAPGHDRDVRLRLDYWIVRDPSRDPAAPFGWRYRSVEVLRAEALASPLASSGASIRVRDVLP